MSFHIKEVSNPPLMYLKNIKIIMSGRKEKESMTTWNISVLSQTAPSDKNNVTSMQHSHIIGRWKKIQQ